MSHAELRDELNHIHVLLGDSIAYGADPSMWDAVRTLAVCVQEILAKLPGE